MNFDDLKWEEWFRDQHLYSGGENPGSPEARASWDRKAYGFSKKPTRSDYITQLIALLDLKPGESVFDMGCGSGTLAVPLAQAGHEVIAVDFSVAMLDELARCAEEADASSRIQRFARSWQESWEDLPRADVAVSSRSFATRELADGIAKLEGQARRKVVLACGAGDRPFRDSRIYEAMGRADEVSAPVRELAVIANYLWAHGRYPRIDYIVYPGYWHHETREGLVESIERTHVASDEGEQRLLEAFLDEHLVFDEARGQWTLDYARNDRWGVLTWDAPSSNPRP